MKLVQIKILLVSMLVTFTTACPRDCTCQDDPEKSTFLVACDGITRGNVLQYIIKIIPQNTTGLSFTHYDDDEFLTENLPVLKNMRMLSIQSGTLKYMPRYLGKVFPNLNSLYISKTEIEKITKDTFERMTELRTLNLNNNYIEAIKGGTFQYAKNLEIINLHSNRIRKLSSKAFAGLTKLNTLMLQNNQLRHIKPDTFNFAKTPTFQAFSEINFEGNRIRKIPNGLFSGIRAIMILNLQDNFLTTIEAKAFQHVQAIFQLKLSKNFIRKFPTSAVTWYNPSIKSMMNTNMITIDLLENPLRCDCNLVRLFTTLRLRTTEANIQAICKHPKLAKNQPFFTHFLPAKIQECQSELFN